MRTDTPQTIRLAEYAPPSHHIETIDLDVRLEPEATRVRARFAVRPNPDAAPGPLVLKGEALKLERLALADQELNRADYTVVDDTLTISNTPAGPFTLDIETTVNPAANKALTGLYLSNGVYCTQCEAEGFRRITYHPDRPDVLSVYTTRIEAAKAQAPVLLSNGNLVEAGDIAETDRHYAVWHDPFSKPSYLFALVAGDLAVSEGSFTTMSGREVSLRIYVEPGKENRTDYALEALKRSMRWDETAFGREYDLDIFMIVAVSDFNMGAMENKGLNVFNDKFILASPDTATDTDYANIEAIIAHEYFHNWTGNRITCRDWFQLCLKEGLTVFRDQEFTSTVRSRAVKRITDVRLLRNNQFPEDAGPLAHPVRPDSYIEINNFYTATVYEKGAEVIRALKSLIGNDAFARGMDIYFARHDGEAATVEDFINCMAEASGRDLAGFMRWYIQAGTPRVTVSARHNGATRTLTLDLEQDTKPTPGQPLKEPLTIPLALGLVGPEGQDLPLVMANGKALKSDIIELADHRRTITIHDVEAMPLLSINRRFSAPIELVNRQSDADLVFLMAHDRDPFNRWQAGQSAATALLIRMIKSDGDFDAEVATATYAQALIRSINDETLEPAFRAEILKLPSEADLAREIAQNVDTDSVHDARVRLRADLGQSLAETLRAVIDHHLPSGPYSPDAENAGRRALAHAALDLLAAGSASGAGDAFDQFERARNMTDRMAALTILKDLDAPERGRALDALYAQFENDHLVVDKWFAIQAASSLPGTLENVRSLMNHPSFRLDNPNRVRALIGTFAMANQVRFNAADGGGFTLVAETVLALDPSNPQVAARLLGAFKSWRILEPVRRGHAKLALERIAASANISKDVYEISTKSLH